jgi:DNA replication and repair protein RecF
VRIESLQLHDLRCFREAVWRFEPGPNLLLGPNGSGKTTILEAIHLLSYGRSFRGGTREVLLRRGAERLTVAAGLRRRDGVLLRVALQRGPEGWAGRIDERPVERLSELLQVLAVCCFEPGSHALIAGAAEQRRTFLDWGLFHVEPTFLDAWRRYQRALRQTNALLKQRAPDVAFEPWHVELAEHGRRIDAWRRGYVARLEPRLTALATRFLPELGALRIRYRSGWGGGEDTDPLAELAGALTRDRERQYTSIGPHRADLAFGFAAAPRREHLSRGQEKLLALAAILAQAGLHGDYREEPAILLLDDLASELDHRHLGAVLEQALGGAHQVLITATEPTPALRERIAEHAWFHVEQSRPPAAAD